LPTHPPDAPQKLKVLREHALIESAVSSSRIEGVEVDQSRVARLMFGKPAPRDRDFVKNRGSPLGLTLHGFRDDVVLFST
jgi:hypothetical protein